MGFIFRNFDLLTNQDFLLNQRSRKLHFERVGKPNIIIMPDRNSEIMVKLFSKLEQVLSVGDNTAFPGHNFLMLENPGTFLKPDFDLNNVNNRFLWSKLLNRIPNNTWIYQDTGGEINKLVDRVLTDKELPALTLTPSQRQQLTNAQQIIGLPPNGSTKYQYYKKYRKAYYDALGKYNSAVSDSQNNGIPIPPNIVDDLNNARAEWNTWGYKNVIENAQATIDNLTALDPNNWWAKMRNDYNNQEVQSAGGQFLNTLTFPTYKDFTGDNGWTKVVLTEEDIVKVNRSSHVDIGGGLSGGWGLWKWSASANYSQDVHFASSDINGISLSFEVLRVTLIRDWVDELMFRTRAWRWAKNSPSSSRVISDGGDINNGITPKGVMPFMPTGMLLARNLQLSGAFSHDDYTRIDTSFSSSASIGWGPISFGGHYNKQTTEEYINANRAGNTISCPDIQIIGWLNDVLPLCPNPDPSLDWPTKMSLEHIPQYSEDFIKSLRSGDTMK